jgi:hypothetical protein
LQQQEEPCSRFVSRRAVWTDENMVEAGIDAVPVRWRSRQQQEEFRYLVQNI